MIRRLRGAWELYWACMRDGMWPWRAARPVGRLLLHGGWSPRTNHELRVALSIIAKALKPK